ncbi:hypothetical protein, partial [Candidatus Pantoea formicae]|uniref:hypothetical protein n=1 Tax=Candidatus Pantoea formicae TaxID=2608355 RepID=UPI003EDB4A1F
RHDVAAEGTAKRREDGPAAAEVLGPAPTCPPAHIKKGRHFRKWRPHSNRTLTDRHYASAGFFILPFATERRLTFT